MTAELETEDSTNRLFRIQRKISALSEIEVEAAGKWLHTYEKYRVAKYNIEDSCIDESSSEEESGALEIEIGDDINYLRSLNPTDWKNQDHYLVLGLSNYRYKARDEDIRKAYRTMVLRHHPDKRKAAGEEIRDDDDYFTCITMAYEVLGIPAKRRAYDSIDPDFDDDLPSANPKSKNKFFETYGPVFERNARWSVRKHPPLLGQKDDSRSKVEHFYNFWYDFDTWREFSYLDEEEKEKGADRDERRWIEKQNKIQRLKRKREEIARIRKLVNNAYTLDPRVIKFQEEEKERKLKIKKAKQDAIRKKQEESGRARREEIERERKIKQEEEEQIKKKQEAEKKERESAKKLYKKERKNLRTFCKDNDYFSRNEAERIQFMTDVELLCEALQMMKLQELNKSLSEADEAGKKAVFMKQVAEVKEQIEREKVGSNYQSKPDTTVSSCSRSKAWIPADLQMLIKAVNLFPAGTAKRWEVVAEYVNQHSTKEIVRNAKEVLTKAKELQNSDGLMREATNKNAFQELVKIQGGKSLISDSHASQRLETPQEMLGVNLTKWSPEEQKLLEQAMKTYPTSTTARWDRIAECLPNRSKKECMTRYKELVERVKAKKAAQNAVSGSK